jgi:hypothetical protein
VFISEDHTDTVITCKALSNTPGINTDCLPILTTLDLDLARAPPSMLKNFRNVDWEDFKKMLLEKLDKLTLPSHINTPSELKAIQETISSKVPTSSIGIKVKKWWTKELKKLRQDVMC